MAGTVNKVTLIGHTGDDVKMKYFEGGGCVGNFPLATNEEYINKSTGEKVSNTEWHNIVVRNKAAEVCEKYLKKGDKVYIEGRIKTRKWQDDKGMDRYITEIQCLEFTFLGTPPPTTSSEPVPEKDRSPKPDSNKPTETKTKPSETPQVNEEEEDDLPF